METQVSHPEWPEWPGEYNLNRVKDSSLVDLICDWENQDVSENSAKARIKSRRLELLMDELERRTR